MTATKHRRRPRVATRAGQRLDMAATTIDVLAESLFRASPKEAETLIVILKFSAKFARTDERLRRIRGYLQQTRNRARRSVQRCDQSDERWPRSPGPSPTSTRCSCA